MERPELTNHDDGDATAPTRRVELSKPKTIEENTGLFDIRTLANMTKKRISERISTEHDVEEALLASASATALSTISLPDMSTELEPYGAGAHGTMDAPIEAPEPFEVLDNPATAPVAPLPAQAAVTAKPASVAAVAAPMPLDKPTPLWVYALVAAVVALGGLAFFVLQGGGEADTDTAMEATTTDEVATPSAKPLEEPVAQPMAEPEPEPAPVVEEEKAPEPAKAEEKKKSDSKKYKRAKKSAPDKSNDDALKAAIDRRKVKASKKGKKKVVDTSDTKKDIDQLLDQAAVGSALAPKEVKKEKAKPTRTEVTRADVKTAMRGVTSKAKGCYNLYEKEGTVQIRFTVQPSGKVAKAKAAGKFKGTDTGKCVAAAVKRAKFPAYDGAPKSFTYPFLLSP